MIAVHKLTKEYHDDGTTTRALDTISCTIQSGEFVAVTGPSGSGKSTLLHILSFLDRPTSGSYTFYGKNMDDLSSEDLAHIRNREMGFIFQAFNLLGRASVYENVELPLMYAGLTPHKRKEQVIRAVEAVGISEKLYIPANQLSGGQKQRVAIARALVNTPKVIFADEPTGNLDSKSGAQVMDILARLNKEGHTIILVTHETYTAAFAKRHLVLHDGRITEDAVIDHKGPHTFFK